MTAGLHRYQQCGDLHFITFSCFHRQPHLGTPKARDLFESALDGMRERFRFVILGYVVMPEHVHLLLNEPRLSRLDHAIQAIKLSTTVRSKQRPFWQARYYDFNVHSAVKVTEKLRYIHRNPVARGLVAQPQDWQWSSFRHYLTGSRGAVTVESFWTAWEREHPSTSKDVETEPRESRVGSVPRSQHQGPGAPSVVR